MFAIYQGYESLKYRFTCLQSYGILFLALDKKSLVLFGNLFKTQYISDNVRWLANDIERIENNRNAPDREGFLCVVGNLLT